ncbi:MAG: SUMF1/EgtB/PvdO family nonheme iron enzyme [Deltaproteobacteria bacterium]|nr:SUMF1/EgtB/PvdO family nonheme iron enzyme [Deltaproteobacteria bacterium]
MKRSVIMFGSVMVVGLLAALAGADQCPPDSVEAGPVCVDKYEASVWSIPATNTVLIKKVKGGTATLAALQAGKATQLGCTTARYNHTAFPVSFPSSGNWTDPVYAVSVAGTLPTACVKWFQAEQACALAGKRLLTNQEWQRAAASTPDGAPCNVSSGSPKLTGTAGCVSAWGAFDMVGNVQEWVADWVPPATTTACSTSLFGTADINCMTIDPTSSSIPSGPAALIRGGSFDDGTGAGVFAVNGLRQPSNAGGNIGFRCGR